MTNNGWQQPQQPGNTGGWQQPQQGYAGAPQQGQQWGQPQGGPQPQQGYPQPGAYAGPATQPPKKKGLPTAAKVGIGVLALAVVAGGGYAIAGPLLGGGDVETASVVPGDSILYVDMNLAPGAGQSLEMIRFGMKIPSFREKFSLNEGTDLKKSLVDSALKDSGCEKTMTYEKDVKPWMGDRVAMTMLRGGKSPIVLVQSKDEAKARAAAQAMAKCNTGSSSVGVAYVKGHLVLAESQAVADGVQSAKDHLSDNKVFKEDMGKLGTTGLVTAWFDQAGLLEVVQEMGSDIKDAGKAGADSARSGAATLRFTGGNPEVATVTKSLKPVTKGKTDIGELPGDAAIAFGMANGKELVPQIIEAAGGDDALSGSGLTRADLETLLGDDLRLSMGAFDPAKLTSSDPSKLPIGVGIKTDRAKLKSVLDKMGGGQQLPVAQVEQGGLVYLSPNQAYATSMSKPAKKLKDTDGFKKAVADPDSAQTAAYVDLAMFKPQLTKSMSAKDRADFEALQSFGLSVSAAGDDYQKGTFRLTAK